MGPLDAVGPGSFTNPDLSRDLHADGKVATPLFKAIPDSFIVDTGTGEVIPIAGVRGRDRVRLVPVETETRVNWSTVRRSSAARRTTLSASELRPPRPHGLGPTVSTNLNVATSHH